MLQDTAAAIGEKVHPKDFSAKGRRVESPVIARWLVLGIVLLWLMPACRDRTHPWEQGSDAGATVLEPAQPVADSGAGRAAGLGADPALPADAGADAAAEEAVSPVRIGGPWVRCYGNFKPSGDPRKDVTRLGLLCGPENGMRRLSADPIEGSVADRQPAFTHLVEGKRGECYRIFAVAEPGVTDLDVRVLSSRGVGIAADHGEDAWPIVQPDRPFCPLADDTLTVEVLARRGQGRFAAEVWVLRTPERPD